ncbi:MAG TPA: hypothetical protein VFL27_07485 [Candidatus Dormibacteraeota bacterium]|nr:hypothetical protein [Candidatus Dormibacteraeota bacterium]
MYLRVTAFKSDPAKIDGGVAYLRDKIIPALKQAPGFVGATCIVDREKGEGAASTIWETLEAMNNAEQLGQQSRTQSAEATGLEIMDVDRFEITILEMGRPDAVIPRYTRLITAYGDPSKADAAVQGLRGTLPKLKAQPGFVGFASGVNRATGRGFTTSTWDTPEHREASYAVIAQERQQILDSGAMYGMDMRNFETVIVDVKLPAAAQQGR